MLLVPSERVYFVGEDVAVEDGHIREGGRMWDLLSETHREVFTVDCFSGEVPVEVVRLK